MCSNQKKESNIQNKKLEFIIIYCNICLAKTNNNQEEASADISPLNVAPNIISLKKSTKAFSNGSMRLADGGART
jgi:hypothetical protein